MTVRAAPRPRRRSAAHAADPIVGSAPELAIGEINQTVFDCPKCSRPLAMGARRCPGCRTRLVIGVTLAKASAFASAGLAIGLLVGAAGGAVFGLSQAPRSATGPVAVAPTLAPFVPGGAGGTSPAPSASEAAPASNSPATSSSPSSPPTIPSSTRAALAQVIVINERLAATSTDLAAALAATPFDASAVAQVLRTVSADSIYGQTLGGTIATWPASEDLGLALTTLYSSIHETAAQGLVASVRNETAYRTAARAMLRLLTGLPAIDKSVQAIVAADGFSSGDPSPAP